MDTNAALATILREEKATSDVVRGSGQEAFTAFFQDMAQLKDYYKKFPNVAVVNAKSAEEIVNNTDLEEVQFSGVENNGRNLDLHEFYDTFLNLQVTKMKREADASYSISYREYVGSFFEFSEDEGKDEEYYRYLQDLLAYLIDFIKRALPLFDISRTLATIERESEEQWDKGTFRSWGADEGSDASEKDPLFCGPCNKRFPKQTTFDGHLKGKKHVAALKRAVREKSNNEELKKKIFLLEVKINRVSDSLSDVIQSTVADIEKKQSRTLREQLDAMEQESEDEDVEEEDAQEEEEQGFVRQIQNYPVGWDGEPIPYWLYRLHGLGVEYKCEICGNTSYWGRRAFEKHFEEFRHQNGMKLLGVPNTAHFFEIVKIQDALDLHKKIQADEKARTWNPDEEVEMEDDLGRVYDKKTYDLLKKQGLLREKKTH